MVGKRDGWGGEKLGHYLRDGSGTVGAFSGERSADHILLAIIVSAAHQR